MIKKLKALYKNIEIKNAYDDFVIFGYYGLSKIQHEFFREECRKLGFR